MSFLFISAIYCYLVYFYFSCVFLLKFSNYKGVNLISYLFQPLFLVNNKNTGLYDFFFFTCTFFLLLFFFLCVSFVYFSFIFKILLFSTIVGFFRLSPSDGDSLGSEASSGRESAEESTRPAVTPSDSKPQHRKSKHCMIRQKHTNCSLC